jgi:hypothetical protein
MRIIESFNGWKRADRLLTENVQAAKQYMLKRFAQAKGMEVSQITPEDQARIFANEEYRKVLQLAQPLPGFTAAFVKFKFDHRVSIEQLKTLFDKIKEHSQFLGELSMPIIDFPNQDKVNGVPAFEALMDEFNQIETRRKAKWILNELPGNLRRAARELPKEDLQRLFNAATIMNDLGKEVKERLLKKAKAFSEPMDFIVYAENYVKGYLNSDVQSKIDKLEELEPEGSVIYADDRYLMLSARTEKAQKELCSVANWCINRGSFNNASYGGGAVQINTFDFGLPPTDPHHLIGTTISYDGKVTYSHDINDRSVKTTDNITAHLNKFGYPDKMINTLLKVFPIEAMIKKVITELNLDKKSPIQVLESVIKASYKINPEDDQDSARVILNILMERIAPSVKEEDIVNLYMKFGVMSIFSAKLFNMLLPNIDPETRAKVIQNAKAILDEIKGYASTGLFKYPQLLNAVKSEPKILELLSESMVNEFYAAEPAIKEPVTKPKVTPRPGPIPTKKPSVNPEPSATAEDVVNVFLAELKKLGTTPKEFLK